MSIYVLLEYIEICSQEHKKATKEGLYKFKKSWKV